MLEASGQRGLGALIAKLHHFAGMGYQTFTKCYYTCVSPITEYGSEIWGFVNYHKVETVQQKAMRVFLGVHKYAANDFLYGDMGWYPSKLRLKLKRLRFWNRLCLMDENRLTKKVFEKDYEQDGQWSQSIREIFEEMNMCNLFESCSPCIIKDCESQLRRNYEIEWERNIKNKSKLRSYVLWKEGFGPEPYVRLNLSRSQRSILAQLRSGTLPLRIETGRFTRVDLNDRICNLCTNNEIESETHFILHCKCYEAERNVFLDYVNVQMGSDEVDEGSVIKNMFLSFPRQMAKFCQKCYKIRQEQEYCSR